MSARRPSAFASTALALGAVAVLSMPFSPTTAVATPATPAGRATRTPTARATRGSTSRVGPTATADSDQVAARMGVPHAPGWSYRLRLRRTLARLGAPPNVVGAIDWIGLAPPADDGNVHVAREAAHAGGGVSTPPSGSAAAERAALQARIPAKARHVLVLGTDRRSDETQWRTDAIVLLSLGGPAGTSGMISIPRDLWVEIPGHGMGRINTADYLGELDGMPDGQLAMDTVTLNLGIPVERFVRVDMRAFIDVVDSLGGIEVPIDCAVRDYFGDEDRGLAVPGWLDLQPGVQRLDGLAGLRYVRSREGTSDLERNRRQQRVLRAVLAKARERNVVRSLPALWSALRGRYTTNIGLRDAVGLASAAIKVSDGDLIGGRIGADAVTDWVTPSGAQVLVPNPAAVAGVVSSTLVAAPARSVQVRVSDASGTAGLGALAAAQLQEAGIAATIAAEAKSHQGSYVCAGRGAEPAAASVAKALRLYDPCPPRSSGAESVPDGEVIARIGADWNPCPFR